MASAARASALYEKYGERVHAFCLARLGNREEAADAVQDTFLKAWLALAKGGEIKRPVPWLLTIAENVCVSRFRARRSRVTEAVLEDAAAVRASQPDVAVDELAAALRALPVNQRRAFLRRELQGYSYDEIGADLGVSRAAVTALLYRARRALASFLGNAGRRAAPCFVPLPQLLRSLLQSGPSIPAAGTAAIVLAMPQLMPVIPLLAPAQPVAPGVGSPTANVTRVLAAATPISAVRPALPGGDVRPSALRTKAVPGDVVSFPPGTQDRDLPQESQADDTAVPAPQSGPSPAAPEQGSEPAPAPPSDPSDPDGEEPSNEPGPPGTVPPDDEGSLGPEPPDDPPQPKGPSKEPGWHGNGPPEHPGSQGNGPPDDPGSQGKGPPSQPQDEQGPPEQPGSQVHAPPDEANSGPPDHGVGNNEPPGSSGSGDNAPPDRQRPEGNGPDHQSHGNDKLGP